MSELTLSRKEFLRVLGVTTAGAVLATCTSEPEDQKLERLNSPLAERIATWMGVSPTTTPEEYAQLCFQNATDPIFATSVGFIGNVVGLNGNQVPVEINPAGGKTYFVPELDQTRYFTPRPLFTHEIVSATNPENRVVFVGTLVSRDRIKTQEQILRPFVKGYLSGNRMPYTIYFIAAPLETDFSELGISLPRKADGSLVPINGVTQEHANLKGDFLNTDVLIILENIHRTSKDFNVPLSASLAATLANERVQLMTLENPSYTTQFESPNFNERNSTLAGILAMISPKYRPLLLGGDFSSQLNIIAEEMEKSVKK